QDSWPYVQIESISLRKRSDLEDMRDVQKILRLHKEFEAVTRKLDKTALNNIEPEMLEDISWRAAHHRTDLQYWDLVSGDFLHQLSSGPSLYNNPLNSKLATLKATLRMERQAVSNLEIFASVQFVRYCFRFFHRNDGVLGQNHST